MIEGGKAVRFGMRALTSREPIAAAGLLRSIQDIRVATEVSLHKLPTENEGLLRQLNMWFPGRFRTATGTPLYAHDETTVVQATHKVILALDLSVMLLVVCNNR